MIQYPYGPPRDAYLNVKEAAKEPWRGITAWVQGNPWLVIDKTDDVYVLENEKGETFVTDRFERWEPATEHSALVAASRLEESPFASGNKAGNQEIGNLLYFEKEWDVRLADLDVALPIEDLVERYDKIRWSKTADLYPAVDYRCPECGSDDIQPSSGWDHSIYECQNCGKQGYEEEFANEEPDRDDMDHDFYPDWTGAKVADFEDEHVSPPTGGGATFEYNLPPAGIHMRSHALMKQNGLTARVHFPPGLQGMFGPIPEVLDVPSQDQQAVMAAMMLDNPEQYTVHVETPHDPAQVQAILDQAGGRHSASTKMGEANENVDDPIVDSQKALTCPNCGSHSLRAFSPNGNSATVVCLTCGNEFERNVHLNPEASVKEAVNPIDPNMSAQVIGLMQQIEEAYQQGDHARAQQLHQQMMQLMNNPNQPLLNAPMANVDKEGYGTGITGPMYPDEPARQAQLAGLMKEISDASKHGDIARLRLLQQQMEQLLGGNPAYASLTKEAPGKKHLPYATPKRNRQYEHILESCREEHPDWSEDRCKELAARTVNKQRAEKGETKSSIDDCGCDGKVTNDKLTSTPEEYNLDTMTFEAQSIYDDPYAGQPVNLDDYTQQGQDPTMDSDNSIDYVHCPACDGPGVLLGQLGKRIHYRCRNCGIDFNEKVDDDNPNQIGPERTAPFGDDMTGYSPSYSSVEDVKDVNENTLKAFKDSSGNPIEAGKLYTLHHPNYKVPDVIRVLNLEDDRIEAAIASDEHGSFPIHITHDEAYSLDPYAKTSGWNVISRKNFSADEQKELINENPEGRARNFNKLDLSGTHYQIKEEATDPNFLLGW